MKMEMIQRTKADRLLHYQIRCHKKKGKMQAVKANKNLFSKVQILYSVKQTKRSKNQKVTSKNQSITSFYPKFSPDKTIKGQESHIHNSIQR